MSRLAVRTALVAALAAPFVVVARRPASDAVASIPAPREASVAPAVSGTQTVVFAGGCFWGVEAVYEHIKGVTDAVSGYAGGTRETADYDAVSSGATGHAEVVRVTFDPAEVTFERLLQVFFSVVHDPTQRNRQGPDVGPQYRSAIFFSTEEQARVARAYIEQLTRQNVFKRPIVTQVTKLEAFYPAEEYHQDFAARNPTHPYIVFHDIPKVERLRREYAALYR
ncbi:MAG TPA: peptide-methionine (S)-S-oxide reductase MsrA [Gemmatimonadaceae bacterium]|nr:peptide-methionine (S)-S-oxide reductase MsrA [Gemmatimonadaceae bacterium]